METNLIEEREKHFSVYEPKKTNRFYVEMWDIPSFVIKSISPIKFSRGRWNDITIEMYDPISPSTSQCIVPKLKNCSLIDKIIVNEVGPVGDKVSEWFFVGNEIIEVDFGSLDWSTDKIKIIKMVLEPSYVIINY